MKIELRQLSSGLLHETRRDKGGKYGGEREIRQRTVSVRLLVLFLIREKWKNAHASPDARVIRLHNYQWRPMHISCRAARAFTLRRQRNEWTYTARTVIAALIITRRKIGLRRCNKCARERNKRRVRMTNCQTISVPSSAVIKDGTTINPVTTRPPLPTPLPQSRAQR